MSQIPAAGRHGVPDACTASTGSQRPAPSQNSAVSQESAAGRPPVLGGFVVRLAGAGHGPGAGVGVGAIGVAGITARRARRLDDVGRAGRISHPRADLVRIATVARARPTRRTGWGSSVARAWIVSRAAAHLIRIAAVAGPGVAPRPPGGDGTRR